MNPQRTSSIPTEAEFNAASRSITARIRAEEELKAKVVEYCGSSSVFHDAYVWLPNGRCHVDLFVVRDRDLTTEESKRLRDGVASLLVGLFEGSRPITVELDSDERVWGDFNGSYVKRFR